MNNKVALYLAGAATIAGLTTGCFDANNVSNTNLDNSILSDISITDISLIPEESIEEISTDISLPESEDNVSMEESIIDEVSQEQIESPAPEEPSLTLTGKTNTQNDVLEAGKVCINNSNWKMPKDIQMQINNAIDDAKKQGIIVGFYLTDIDTNMTISYNADRDFQPASTVKAGVALCATKQIEAGKFNFDDKMTYTSKHYCRGSGNIRYSAFGTEYTLQDIIHRTINISDNVAYYMLLDKFGTEFYNNTITDLGCKTWLNNYTKWGYLTPQELNLIWQEIYAYGQTSEEGKWLYNEFLNAEFNFIKECLPEYHSAHKSGFNEQGYHDSAVVYGDRRYIMTIMTTQDYHDANMNKIAVALDNAVKAYDKYMNAQNEDQIDKEEIFEMLP